MKPFVFRRSKTACFCGDTEDDIKMYCAVDDAVNNGAECFLFSAENEKGLLFARQVLLRKKKQKGNKADKISLVAVIAEEHFASEKDENFRESYFDVVSQCDDVIVLNTTAERAAEKFIIAKASLML